MNSTIDAQPCPSAACSTSRCVTKRNWFATLWRRRWRHTNTILPDFIGVDDPWASAVSQVDHLDAHVLADIGAPRWVIDEVNRRQHDDGFLNPGKKW